MIASHYVERCLIGINERAVIGGTKGGGDVSRRGPCIGGGIINLGGLGRGGEVGVWRGVWEEGEDRERGVWGSI